MTYSEKTARRIDQYTRTLVRRQPSWLRELFDNERILFIMDDDGSLALNMDTSIEEKKKEHAARLIAKYISKHPCEAISMAKIH